MEGVIHRMVAGNNTNSAPRLHSELEMLGFDISERTLLRWSRKPSRSPELAKQ
jgi:hypothetical protein